MIVATTDRIPGFRITAVLGIVRGVVVRSPSIGQGIAGALENVFGGNIKAYDNVCEDARKEAAERMVRHARDWQRMGYWECVTMPRSSPLELPRFSPTEPQSGS